MLCDVQLIWMKFSYVIQKKKKKKYLESYSSLFDVVYLERNKRKEIWWVQEDYDSLGDVFFC